MTPHYTRGSVTTLHDFGTFLLCALTMSWSRLLACVLSGRTQLGNGETFEEEGKLFISKEWKFGWMQARFPVSLPHILWTVKKYGWMKAHFVAFMVPLKLPNVLWTAKKYGWMRGHIAQSMVGFLLQKLMKSISMKAPNAASMVGLLLQTLMKSISMKAQNVASMAVTYVHNCHEVLRATAWV